MGLGIHFGGLGNVAALDVGNDRQAGGAGQLEGLGVGAHAVQAQGLVVGDLHLVAACHSLSGSDQRAVEIQHVLAGGLGGVGGGQVADLGIQADADRAVGSYALVQFIHVRQHCVLPRLYNVNCLLFDLERDLATLDGGDDLAVQQGAIVGAVLTLAVEALGAHLVHAFIVTSTTSAS